MRLARRLSVRAPLLRLAATTATMASASAAASTSAVKSIEALQFPVQPPDPFLFTAWHVDDYPAGDAQMRAPKRGNGADFTPEAPYRMYHGTQGIPGFPRHGHRGFETLTASLGSSGTVDHADSAGNSGRFGGGDMMWMTAGGGVQHSEMFPLIHADKPNPLKIFQIWLNLPRKSKMAPPAFAMHWAEKLVKVPGVAGAQATIYAGRLGDIDGHVTPPPHSWAVDPANDVAVAVFSLPAGGSRFTIPASPYGDAINRVLYVTDAGRGMSVGGKRLSGPAAVTLRAGEACELVNGDAGVDGQALLLQGRPISEPVVQHGPFVMNTRAEIMETFAEYRRTRFGGWPWGDEEDEAARGPVFPRDKGRFASYRLPDGTTRVEYPPGAAEAGGAGKKDEL